MYDELVGSQWLEVGGKGSVLCNDDGAWIVGIAIMPCSKLVALAWECLNNSSIIVAGVWRWYIRLTHAVVVGLNGEDIGGYFVDWERECSPICICQVCLFSTAEEVNFYGRGGLSQRYYLVLEDLAVRDLSLLNYCMIETC